MFDWVEEVDCAVVHAGRILKIATPCCRLIGPFFWTECNCNCNLLGHLHIVTRGQSGDAVPHLRWLRLRKPILKRSSALRLRSKWRRRRKSASRRETQTKRTHQALLKPKGCWFGVWRWQYDDREGENRVAHGSSMSNSLRWTLFLLNQWTKACVIWARLCPWWNKLRLRWMSWTRRTGGPGGSSLVHLTGKCLQRTCNELFPEVCSEQQVNKCYNSYI